MKVFKTIKLKNMNYDYLIVVLTYESILTFIKSLEKLLKVDEATVIFDLAISNGTNYNRYIKASIKKGKFELSSFEVISKSDINFYIKKQTNNFFLKNLNLLEESVLTKREISELLKI